MTHERNPLSSIEEDASALTQAALALSRAMESKDTEALSAALDTNLKLWIGIRTLVSRDGNPLPKEVRENLIQLAQFVTKTTADARNGGKAEDLEAMINTNLQISEGLLEGQSRAVGHA